MKTKINKRLPTYKLFLLLSLSFLMTGCASDAAHDDSDPLENINRPIFEFNETLDRNFMKPVAKGYVKVTPEPLRKGITNFFDNVTYLNVIFNDILQGKFSDAASDSTRFVLNSTLGMLGLFDPASDLGLKKNNEDLGQSLAVWGVGQGAYLNLPLMGPNTVRKTPDLVTSSLLNPLTYMTAAVTIPATIVNVINLRANLLDATKFRDEAALDKYAFTREAYLQQRLSLIYDGNPPEQELDDFFDEDFDSEDPGESGDQLLIE